MFVCRCHVDINCYWFLLYSDISGHNANSIFRFEEHPRCCRCVLSCIVCSETKTSLCRRSWCSVDADCLSPTIVYSWSHFLVTDITSGSCILSAVLMWFSLLFWFCFIYVVYFIKCTKLLMLQSCSHLCIEKFLLLLLVECWHHQMSFSCWKLLLLP